MHTLLQDARYALAMMRRNKGFTAAGLLTLALGIGATTAALSMVYGVLLRPRPYPAADRFVRVWEEHPGGTPVGGSRWISNRTRLTSVDAGYTADRVLTARLLMPRGATPERTQQFIASALGEVRATPGVRAARIDPAEALRTE